MEANSIKIGRRIKEARERIKMTQEQLSISLGCSLKHIGALERGIKSPKLETLIKIINILHTTPDILLQDTINLNTNSNYDKNISSLIGWLPDEDKDMILRIITTISMELYDRNARSIME